MSKQSIEEAAEKYALEQMEFNKWLRELTDDEAIHLKTMLNEFALSDAAKEYWFEQFKAQEQSDENVGSLVKRFGEVVAEKQKYKELYEQECTNHNYTRLSWDRTCEERDKLKAQEQKPGDIRS